MSSLDRSSAARRGYELFAIVAALLVGACGATDSAPPPPPSPPALPPAGVPAPAPVPLATPAEPWDSIARCETGGDWHADTGNGYQGGLQLSLDTWTTHGGGEFAPEPVQATREQQILVGERIRAQQGWEAWSGCADELAPG